MRLKYVKILALLLFCCTAFVSKGKCSGPDFKHKQVSIKLFNQHDGYPVNQHITVNLLEGNQEITRPAVKTATNLHVVYLTTYNFDNCAKCLNFFSGYSRHRHTLSSKVLLFPFHAFW